MDIPIVSNFLKIGSFPRTLSPENENLNFLTNMSRRVHCADHYFFQTQDSNYTSWYKLT